MIKVFKCLGSLQKLISQTDLYTPPGHSTLFHTQQFKNLSMIRNGGHEIHGTSQNRVSDVYLVAEEKELGGKNRYVADGFLNSTECDLLMQLASVRWHYQIVYSRTSTVAGK